jgi:UDP-glucose:(heptosyl)LPS alpha-1,3-glucosyltransferase
MSVANKKIAMITERIDIALGGAERSVFELSDALSALGLEVDILAAKGQANAKNVHILCQDAPGKRTCYFTFAKALKRHLSANHYCLVHSVVPFDFVDVYQPRAGCFAESVLRNAASYQNKVIEFYKKATAFTNFRRDILLWAERKLCTDSNGPIIAALSRYIAEQFENHYGVSADRLVVVPNGIKINERIDIGYADNLRSQILAQLGLKEADRASPGFAPASNPVFFLFAANNFRLKGLACLIRAMHLVSQSVTGRQAYLVVAGSGGTYKYRRLAKRFGFHRKVVFLGSVSHIQNVLSIMDVAVLPTFYDPSSRFILEAIAAGKPVITTKFNGAVDLFVNDRHGKVIDCAENIPALAQAISFFTDTNNIRKASQAIVEDKLEEKVSVSRLAEQLIPVYESILEKREK